MPPSLNDLTGVDELRQRARVAEETVVVLQTEVDQLKQRIALLEGPALAAALKNLKRTLLELERAKNTPGGKGESRADAFIGPIQRLPQTGHGPTPQPTLHTIEDPVETLDEADRKCPDCEEGKLCEWEGHVDESETIDVVVGSYTRRICKKQKYTCNHCGRIESALPKPRVVPGGRYSNEFALQVAVRKFLDHLPLTRQATMMLRAGLLVTSQTLWDQEWALYNLLKDLGGRLHEYLLVQSVLGADETRWPVFGNEKRNWTMWCLSNPDAVFFTIKDGRGAVHGRTLLKGFTGILMVDGYAVYEALAKECQGLTLVFCWAHVRRHFLEAENAFPVEVKQALDLIQELFAIEHRAQASKDLLRLRHTESEAVLVRIREFLSTTPALPECSLRKAMNYTASRWTGLTRFTSNADIPLTNNATERGQRGPVVGRKNHYGSHSESGTQAAALFYSLLESAKLCGLNPEAYLRHVMDAALEGSPLLLPHEVRDLPDLQLRKTA